MKANELTEGCTFKRAGQRKWRTVHKVMPVNYRGQDLILVVLPNCRQVVLNPEKDLNARQPGYNENNQHPDFD